MAKSIGDKMIRLSDGRRLGFAEYGDPSGWPVMFFHGTPGSRVMARFAEAKAWEMGIRLIAPDRPGFGLSDIQPRRRLLDWAKDVEELASALGLEKFTVIGVSGGGPYALVCAGKMDGRVINAGIVSSLAPEDKVRQKLKVSHRITAMMMRQTKLLTLVFGLLAWGARKHPEIIIKALGLMGFWEERSILSEAEVQITQIDSVVEAFRQGAQATALELRLFSLPWGFKVEEIKIPVHLWHGVADAVVPVSLGRYLADHIPCCEARFISGAGHLWIFEGYEEILQHCRAIS